MRLATFGRLLLGVALIGAALGQDNNGNGNGNAATTGTGNGDGNNNTASTGANTNSPSQTSNTITSRPTPTSNTNSSRMGEAYATITSVVANANGQGSTTMVFTVAVPAGGNSSSLPNNVTVPTNVSSEVNGTNVNGTDPNNTTAIPWNDTMSYLPFKPPMDPAYGIGGGLLILSGIPVATLGGKNRWSALAIISGYSVGLFCLIMILSFGVTPALQPPSPNPPSAAMRGLYLLAVGISFLIGSGLGIFFFTFAKYWVGAAGGFSIGWFLLALRKGGLVTSVGPRWAIVGGLTVAAILAALTPQIHEYVLLIASAWVGATAFTLGVDCFTRAGLKEFYMYNLGFEGAFPSLNGGKFPLTQNMQVELGVIAAAAIIASAIQFKLVNTLQKRRKKLAAQEEARLEAAEIDRAAEHFKNVDTELAEWEGKYGFSDSGSNTITPTLAKSSMPTLRQLSSHNSGGGKGSMDSGAKRTSTAQLDPAQKRRSLREERLSILGGLNYGDENSRAPDTPDPELEQKLQLLSEVRKARQSIRSSMDHLRSSPGSSDTLDGAEPGSTSRRNSTSSSKVLDRGRYDSGASSVLLLNNAGHARNASTSNVPLLDEHHTRRDSLGPRPLSQADPVTEGNLAVDGKQRPLSDHQLRPTNEWDKYVQSRNIVSPPPVSPAKQPAKLSPQQPPVEHFAVVSDSVGRALTQRGESRNPVPSTQPATLTAQEYGTNLARALSSNEMAAAASFPSPGGDRRAAGGAAAPRRISRTMTTEELAERHREVINRMQDRVTGPIKEEQALAEAKEAWEKRQRAEREEQRRREERAQRGVPLVPETTGSKTAERSRRTDDWRRSVAMPPAPGPSPRRHSGNPTGASHRHSGTPAAAVATTSGARHSGTPAGATAPNARHSGTSAGATSNVRSTSPVRRQSGVPPVGGPSPSRPTASTARPGASRRASRQNFIA